jgi:hypothetical protein
MPQWCTVTVRTIGVSAALGLIRGAGGAGGPGPGQAIPVGSSSHTISVGGTSRTFLVGVVTTSTASCPDSRTVELITIAGAGGQWPGATPNVLWPKSSCTPTRSPRR